ncbi:hypothetical protein M406DRAFT_336747 [Cryphonectria parasitica EP155]|uniref:GDP/GTP exchange factor Sec2 N-terminal domain-containing protein n=1 Tax=Cryphonectria parasitica (strain ATCC 38755 / EP155) TaxID=660469 RepID=A0A9P5CVD2_CRYP1|nr:uncharacterized protein M406DRAFT_336747 [Cryphonectria parasitica EP155]KAF3771272.1 hypothetical protein M406DRAFT_336747 [Cryphonectria parasitica EP155]
MTLTMPVLPPPRLSTIPCCPKCGNDLSLTFNPTANSSLAGHDADETTTAAALHAAQRQIDELQAQIRLLNTKATAAVDRWADYEDELSTLRRDLQRERQGSVTPQTPTVQTPTSPPRLITGSPSAGVSSFATAATNRISALLSRNGQTLSYTPGASPPPSTDDLLDALTREHGMRLAAEGKLNDTSREVEELSVTLFEQANEMVATERRARAQLEERVGELERRDKDKGRRLQRLESAMGRIERARNLLKEEVVINELEERR